ncbi:MAG: fibronectin type domain protein [Bacteroidetes bacterium]|nr:fibronectin type domain protein [Bacteroidota bacterium]
MKKITKIILVLTSLATQLCAYAQPSASAPTPTYAATKVASLYSDTYSLSPSSINYNAGTDSWGATTEMAITKIGSTDNVLKYSSLTYLGWQFSDAICVKDLSTLHIDIYSVDVTSLEIFPISTSTSGYTHVTESLTTGSWNSFDIPISSFTNQDFSAIDQFQIIANTPSSGGTIYLDNVYFYTSGTTVDTTAPTGLTASSTAVTSNSVTLSLNATDDSGAVFYTITGGSETVTVGGASAATKLVTISGLTGATSYIFTVTPSDRAGNLGTASTVNATTISPIPASPTPTATAISVNSIYSDYYTAAVAVPSWDNWYNCPIGGVILADSGNALMFNVSTAGCGGTGGFSALNLTSLGMTSLHLDVYPTTATSIGVCLVSGTASSYVSLGTLTSNEWNSIDLPLSTNYSGYLTAVTQVGFNSASTGIFYMDNLYFKNSSISGISDEEQSQDVECYLGSDNQLVISSDANLSNLSIYNHTGLQVKSIAINSTTKIVDLNNIISGCYICKITTTAGAVVIRKILKH